MRRLSRSHEEQDILETHEWFQYHLGLLNENRQYVLLVVAAGGPLIAPLAGLTLVEIREFFDRHREELDNLVMMGLFASTEAAIRLDYADRVERRDKDALSRHFRRVFPACGHRADLEKVLLKGWKRFHPELRKSIGGFVAAMALRNWLAHGRFWNPKLGREYGVTDVFDICRTVLKEMVLIDS